MDTISELDFNEPFEHLAIRAARGEQLWELELASILKPAGKTLRDLALRVRDIRQQEVRSN